MLMKYQCSFCKKMYDWYEGVYENPSFESNKAHKDGYDVKPGVFVKANSFVLKSFQPIPGYSSEKLDVDEADGNLEGMVINLCSDCMRELLRTTYPSNEDRDCFMEV